MTLTHKNDKSSYKIAPQLVHLSGSHRNGAEQFTKQMSTSDVSPTCWLQCLDTTAAAEEKRDHDPLEKK